MAEEMVRYANANILQQAVQDYLSHYPGIANFSFAPPEDGGTGKTYVELAV